jgi:hypothetical protein
MPRAGSAPRDILQSSDSFRRTKRSLPPPAGVGEKAGHTVVEYFMRTWFCRHCGRSNQTPVALDGRVTCAYCKDVIRIQPSRDRGGETPSQLSRVGPTNPTVR